MRKIVTLIILLAPPAAWAAEDWMPAFVQDAAAQDLAANLSGVGGGRIPEAERLDAARVAVQQVVERIDSWGLAGVLERAPSFSESAPEIEIPPLADARVAAIARYGICALPLDPASAPDDSKLVDDAMGEIAIGLLAGLLRHHYLAGGGTDDALRTDLASEAMNALSGRIAADEGLKGRVREGCSGVLTALLE